MFIEVIKRDNYGHLLSEVSIVLKLILVLPASNSLSERSFSALKRVKTYLRNRMDQVRFNHLCASV